MCWAHAVLSPCKKRGGIEPIYKDPELIFYILYSIKEKAKSLSLRTWQPIWKDRIIVKVRDFTEVFNNGARHQAVRRDASCKHQKSYAGVRLQLVGPGGTIHAGGARCCRY